MFIQEKHKMGKNKPCKKHKNKRASKLRKFRSKNRKRIDLKNQFFILVIFGFGGSLGTGTNVPYSKID